MGWNLYRPTEEERGYGVQFERVHRITGYLTHTINTWGSAKKAELKDRVKHTKSKEVVR